MTTLHFVCKHFDDLHLRELYAAIVLRQEVFVVEQNCPYLDADGIRDFEAHHLFCYDEAQQLVAYTRLIPEGISYEGYTSIGRVINASSVRGTGIGKKLMEKSIEEIRRLFGDQYPIKIGAQQYLEKFYGSLGFAQSGEGYLEDDIPHIPMVRNW